MKVTILFYPDPLLPKPLSRVYRILQNCDWIYYHNDPNKPHDLHFFWSYTKSKAGFIYQKYIENKEENLFVKYRVCYADGVKYIVKKYNRSVFNSDYVKTVPIPKEDLFTPEQEQDLMQKCRIFGVDFAELDVMIYNGQPVVIDVNNVVGGGLIHAETGTSMSDEMDKTFFDFIRDRVSR